MAETSLQGLPASPGLAIGRARVLAGRATTRETIPEERRPQEVQRAHAALEAAAAELEALAERLGGDEAEIIRAGVLMAHDPVLVDDVERAVLDGLPAAAALEAGTTRHAAAIAALDDATLAARAEDVRSLGRRAIRLAEETPSAAATAGPSAAAERSPSATAGPSPSGAAGPSPSGAATAGPSGAATAGPSGAATAGPSGAATAGPSGAATPAPSTAAEARPDDAPPPAEVILVAEELGPADVAELGPEVVGLALAGGAPTAHAAVVARGLGLPLVVGLGEEVLGAPRGEPIVVDGGRGSLS